MADRMTATPSLRGERPEVEPLEGGRDERYVLLDLSLAVDGRLPARMDDPGIAFPDRRKD